MASDVFQESLKAEILAVINDINLQDERDKIVDLATIKKRKKLKRLKDTQVCIHCFVSKSSFINFCCDEITICINCAKRVRICPACGQEMKGLISVVDIQTR